MFELGGFVWLVVTTVGGIVTIAAARWQMASENEQPEPWEAGVARIRGRVRHVWSDDEDTMLVEILREMVVRGAEHGFESRPGIRQHIVNNMKQRLGEGTKISVSDVGDQLKKLKFEWRVVCDMLNVAQGNGFTWDAETHSVKAEEHIWEAYVAVRRCAGKYRKKPFPLHEKLNDIFMHHGHNVG